MESGHMDCISKKFELSIIIVNYNSAKELLGCLHSIYSQTTKITFEIIIVDNTNSDDDQLTITSQFHSILWIKMNYNAGFARANNEGMRQATGDMILLLNPDTIIENNAIEKCIELFTTSPYIACGIQLLNEDRSTQISGNYFMKGGLNYLLPLPVLGSLIKQIGIVFKVKKPNIIVTSEVIEVDWINGAFLMIKRLPIINSELMDEDFFLYAEEAEWCYRLKKYGRICIFGEVNVIHLQGVSANEKYNSVGKRYYNLYDRKGCQIMLSNFIRIRKQFGVWWFIIQLIVYIIEIPIFAFVVLLTKKYSWKHFFGYCRNVVYVVLKCLKIIQNKPYFYKVNWIWGIFDISNKR